MSDYSRFHGILKSQILLQDVRDDMLHAEYRELKSINWDAQDHDHPKSKTRQE